MRGEDGDRHAVFIEVDSQRNRGENFLGNLCGYIKSHGTYCGRFFLRIGNSWVDK